LENVILFYSISQRDTFDRFCPKDDQGNCCGLLTLKALQGVNVRIKHTRRGTVTNATGVFILSTSPIDTLVLSLVGYRTLELPLLFEEEDILIRLGRTHKCAERDNDPGTRLYDKEIVRTQHTQPHAMSKGEAFSSPWTYFSRGEREKRKVVRLINENDRIRTYVEVIHDVELRESIMDAHELTEIEYYNALAKFNQQSDDVLYSTDPYLIESSLRSFFDLMYP
jgi:hypothetical protein